MPIVKVPGLGDVEFPEGMSNAQMEAAIGKTLKHKAGTMAAEGPQPLNIAGFDTGLNLPQGVSRFLASAGKVGSDTWQGVKQRFGKVGPQEVAATRAQDAPLMDTTAGKVGNFVGNVAMTVPTMFIPGVNAYKGAAIVGGLLGGSQPTVEGESPILNAGAGAGGGVLGQGVGNAIGRVIKPVQAALPAAESSLAADAARRGIPLTAGQQTGSRPLQIAESVMENLPFTSGPQLAQKQAQKTAYNRAVGSTFGSAEDAITPEVMGAARSRIGQQFTDLSGRNTLQADDALMTGLAQVDEHARRYLTPDVGRVVLNRLDDVMARIENGTMTGTAYRNLDSELGQASRNAANGDLRHSLGQLRGTLREAMDRSISPADRQAWQGARRQYANLMTVAPIAARSETGDISGRTLLNAANTANKNARFGAPSELADIGRVGRAFVADNVPNSGTAQRQMMQSLLTGGGGTVLGGGAAAITGNDPVQGALIGGGLTAGGLLLPKAFQMLMNSPAGQSYLTQGLLPLTTQQRAIVNALSRGGAAGLLGNANQ